MKDKGLNMYIVALNILLVMSGLLVVAVHSSNVALRKYVADLHRTIPVTLSTGALILGLLGLFSGFGLGLILGLHTVNKEVKERSKANDTES